MRHLLPALAVFAALSVLLSLLWPRAVPAIAGRLERPAARLLVATSGAVAGDARTADGRRVIVLRNGLRRPLAPMLEKTASLAPAIFVALVVAACGWAPARERLRRRRGVAALGAAAAAVAVVELLAGWLAITYALAAAGGGGPGGALRLATVTANAARAFVPFVTVFLALRAAGVIAAGQGSSTTRTASPPPPATRA